MIQVDFSYLGWNICHLFDDMIIYLQPAHEKIGVVDSQWIVHQVVPSLGNQVCAVLLFFFTMGFFYFLKLILSLSRSFYTDR